jgi:hypothetical protein
LKFSVENAYYFRGYAALDGDKFACMDKIRQMQYTA